MINTNLSSAEVRTRVKKLNDLYGGHNLRIRDQELWEVVASLSYLGALQDSEREMALVLGALHLVYQMGFDDGTKS